MTFTLIGGMSNTCRRRTPACTALSRPDPPPTRHRLVNIMSEEIHYVLDASAVLAFDREEPGSMVVEAALNGSVLSTVTLAEVIFRYAREGVARSTFASDLERLGVRIEPFTAQDGALHAKLHTFDTKRSLSLGDRCCLAVAQRLGRTALTADRYWGELDLPIDVQLIR
ncbi:MAG: type II toxin-antitoxin system VapC family toxin [Mycobacteriales bacterium]